MNNEEKYRTTEQRYEYALKIIMAGRDKFSALSYEGLQVIAKEALAPTEEWVEEPIAVYRVYNHCGSWQNCASLESAQKIMETQRQALEIVELRGTRKVRKPQMVTRREEIEIIGFDSNGKVLLTPTATKTSYDKFYHEWLTEE